MTQGLYLLDAGLTRTLARVLACDPVPEGYAVVPDRSVLHPGGGGQPEDHGSLGGQPVLRLEARPDGALVHVVAAPVAGEVEIQLDWPRRLDHMQQHTAQHLLTALAQARFGLRTIAFHLGPTISDLELDADAVDDATLRALEDAANDAVRAALPVHARVVSREAYDEMRADVRSRRLPAGLEGPIRLVEIEGIDVNTCGGTHARNTAEVQAIVLAGTERLSRGTRVFYLAGGRVRAALHAARAREQALTRLLSTAPEGQPDAVARALADARAQARAADALRAELAAELGRALADDPAPVAAFHRDDADPAFLRSVALAARARRPDLTVLATAGATSGPFVLMGPEPLLQAQGRAVVACLAGKGGGRGELLQGMAGDLAGRAGALALLLAEASARLG